ncbi:MAG: hypothetical protein EZS28_005160, partial [Streblomastix strix]
MLSPQKTSTDQSPPQSPTKQTKNQRILHDDDDEDVQQIFGEIIEEKSINTHESNIKNDSQPSKPAEKPKIHLEQPKKSPLKPKKGKEKPKKVELKYKNQEEKPKKPTKIQTLLPFIQLKPKQITQVLNIVNKIDWKQEMLRFLGYSQDRIANFRPWAPPNSAISRLASAKPGRSPSYVYWNEKSFDLITKNEKEQNQQNKTSDNIIHLRNVRQKKKIGALNKFKQMKQNHLKMFLYEPQEDYSQEENKINEQENEELKDIPENIEQKENEIQQMIVDKETDENINVVQMDQLAQSDTNDITGSVSEKALFQLNSYLVQKGSQVKYESYPKCKVHSNSENELQHNWIFNPFTSIRTDAKQSKSNIKNSAGNLLEDKKQGENEALISVQTEEFESDCAALNIEQLINAVMNTGLPGSNRKQGQTVDNKIERINTSAKSETFNDSQQQSQQKGNDQITQQSSLIQIQSQSHPSTSSSQQSSNITNIISNASPQATEFMSHFTWRCLIEPLYVSDFPIRIRYPKKSKQQENQSQISSQFSENQNIKGNFVFGETQIGFGYDNNVQNDLNDEKGDNINERVNESQYDNVDDHESEENEDEQQIREIKKKYKVGERNIDDEDEEEELTFTNMKLQRRYERRLLKRNQRKEKYLKSEQEGLLQLEEESDDDEDDDEQDD